MNWQWFWDRRNPIAAGLTSILLVVCPLLPPQAQGPCVAVNAGIHTVAQLLETFSGGSGTASAPTCRHGLEGAITTQPKLCRCIDAGWVDYFDGGVCGP